MKKFSSYVIGVLIAMALVMCAVWLKGGVAKAKTVGIFFMGWVAGAVSMYVRKEIVEKKGLGQP
jgi:ABC-type proline/glycine betaine transport system substrate-binding protein